ncbi:MAG: class I SAM-dependent methyltransferase [Thermoplasmata archaeon]|nr:MAG: class I SAM-dependent methyltransferase [Thermoplasmata archaeon]
MQDGEKMQWTKWFDERAKSFNNDHEKVGYSSKKSMSYRYNICLSNIEIKENMSMVDVGCGVGNFEEFLSENYGNINMFGIDPSPNMVKVARQKNLPAEFFLGDIIRLPFKSNSMDCIISIAVLQNFDGSWEDALSEMVRILDQGGQLFFTTIDRNYKGHYEYEYLTDSEARLNTRSYVPKEISKFLESLGIKIIKMSAFSTADGTELPLHEWDKFFVYGIKEKIN